MKLFLPFDDAQLAARRAAVAPGGPLAPLADSIAADLEIVMARPLYIPKEKALLSRAGGRCEDDATQLEFDPYSPDEHRCPKCGRVHTGAFHHRWWVYWYQLWLAERGVNAAVLHLLRGDPRHAEFTRNLLGEYGRAYTQYPNVDNVLGPTRLFFSTYLESIWLLQICVMVGVSTRDGSPATASSALQEIIRPSSSLIAQYDEGMSNRQVWNNAAMIAASLLLGDRDMAAAVVSADYGVETHLAEGLLDDGTWYEGENYHAFAHRGLWYCVTLVEAAGIEIDPKLVARFNEGFAAPFASALPDFTLPSRKDSQYAISLRQPRFAESCELGIARNHDARLAGALATLYSGDTPRGDTNRARSTADVERNLASTSLTRADLGWRSLLFARPTLPSATPTPPSSTHLMGQGLSVFRREEGRVYIALDWGQSGGGHGHPDRLNLTFVDGTTRWLDDLGTGSYVDPSLHWYRSTLAHNAPLIDGRSQARVDGELLAKTESAHVETAAAMARNIAPGVTVTRNVMVFDDYFEDIIAWAAAKPVRFELPIHFDGGISGVALQPGAMLDGGTGLEDGFEFARDVASGAAPAGEVIELNGARDGKRARAFVHSTVPSRWFRADAPGQPATESRTFYLVRCEGTDGMIRSVWSWSGKLGNVRFAGGNVEIDLEDTHDSHVVKETVHGGLVRELPRPLVARRPARKPIELPRSGFAAFDLGEGNYRRSEQTWDEAGRPSARVTIGADGDELLITVNATADELVFVPANAVNLYDNEHPDINGHGVQLYVHTRFDGGAWVIVPENGSPDARVRGITGWGSLEIRRAEWKKSEHGFSIDVRVALPPLPDQFARGAYPVSVDVIVNETARGRDRRRGQLVLSGAQGEFVYLQGDRHDPARLVPLMIVG